MTWKIPKEYMMIKGQGVIKVRTPRTIIIKQQHNSAAEIDNVFYLFIVEIYRGALRRKYKETLEKILRRILRRMPKELGG
jgi:hypothetical protein